MEWPNVTLMRLASKRRISILFSGGATIVALLLLLNYRASEINPPPAPVTNSVVGVSVKDVKLRTPGFTILTQRSVLDSAIAGRDLPDRLRTATGDKLDEELRALVLDRGISRAEKLSLIFTGFQARPDEAHRFLEWLRLLEPIELTDELIATFNSRDDMETKKLLLWVLKDATNFASSMSSDAPADQFDRVGVETEKIQDLFKVAALGSNSEIKREALLSLPALLTDSDLVEVLNASNWQDNKAGNAVNYDEIMGIWMEGALGSSESQENLLPDLIKHLSIAGNEIQDDRVMGKIFELMRSADASPEVSAQLSDYLKRVEPSGGVPNDFYNWLEAYESLVPEGDRLKVTSRYLLDGTPSQRAGILINQPREFLGSFSDNELLGVVDALRGGIEARRDDGSVTGQIREALQVLAESENPSIARYASEELAKTRD